MNSDNHETVAAAISDNTSEAAVIATNAGEGDSTFDEQDISRTFADDYPRILRYIRSLVRDPAEAEDLTQETFLRAHRSQSTLRDPELRLTWLYRIATNICVDRLRQKARRPATADIAPEELDLVDADPTLQQIVERSEMGACVQNYLANLPDAYRAVVLLHDLQARTTSEIAEMLGVSPGTVKIRLHRARRKLRAALDAGCQFSHDDRNVLVCEPRG